MTKIAGTMVARFMQQTGKYGGCLDLCLEIYKQKRAFKGVIWDSSFRGWKGCCYKPIKIMRFGEANPKNDYEEIRKLIGFVPENAMPGYGRIWASYPETNFNKEKEVIN